MSVEPYGHAMAHPGVYVGIANVSLVGAGLALRPKAFRRRVVPALCVGAARGWESAAQWSPDLWRKAKGGGIIPLRRSFGRFDKIDRKEKV